MLRFYPRKSASPRGAYFWSSVYNYFASAPSIPFEPWGPWGLLCRHFPQHATENALAPEFTVDPPFPSSP
jgi:hypothetical protein